MPIIRVEGVPPGTEKRKMEIISNLMMSATANIPELGLTPSQVTVSFPADLYRSDLGEVIIVTVNGLFEKPERTDAVRYQLVRVLGLIVATHFKNVNKVESMMSDPAKGFWSSTDFDEANRTASFLRVVCDYAKKPLDEIDLRKDTLRSLGIEPSSFGNNVLIRCNDVSGFTVAEDETIRTIMDRYRFV